MWLAYGGMMGLYARRRAWKSISDGRNAMLRFRICPACGYNLRKSEPESDGCIVCPECAAAWRLPV